MAYTFAAPVRSGRFRRARFCLMLISKVVASTVNHVQNNVLFFQKITLMQSQIK